MNLASICTKWVAFTQRHALWVSLLVFLFAGACGYYTIGHIGINTDNADMISPEVSWRKNYLDYQKDFPQYTDSLAIVIDADNADIADDAQQKLAAALRKQPELFRHVYLPGGDKFFARNGLLFLPVDELQDLSDRLIEVQPFLGRLAPDPSLSNFFDLMARAMAPKSDGPDFNLDPIFLRLTTAFKANRKDKFYRFPWQSLIAGDDAAGQSSRKFIELQPKLEFDALSPAAAPMQRIRVLAQKLQLDAAHGVRVRLTGQAALDSEALTSVSKGAALGAGLALLVVALILLFALRSIRLVVASIVTLLLGLVVTAAFAAAVVGTLNLISVAFAVLYIGLGIDYAIHLCMRYRELVIGGMQANPAMQTAAGDVGASLAICAITTAVGFYAFIPTAYAGVAQLGLISGTGMFISLLITLTLLPALLALVPLRTRPAPTKAAKPARLAAWPQTRRRLVLALALVAAAGAAATLPKVHFNADALDLNDPTAESVVTYRELLASDDESPQSLVAVAPNLAAAKKLSARLSALPEVDKAISVADFVPKNQKAKLAIIDDLAFTLALVAPSPLKAHTLINRYHAIAVLKGALNDYLEAHPAARKGPAGQLDDAMEAWNDEFNRTPLLLRAERLQKLQEMLLAGLPPRLKQLQVSLRAQRVTLDNLPDSLRRRWVAADGRYRVEAFPSADLDDLASTQAFIGAVTSVAPQATGAPVVQQAAGRTVVHSFIAAFSYAVLGISILLLLLLRNIADTLRVLAPLGLVALLVSASTVVLGIPFNFANVIALPLLFGVGVDNGIHVVHRMRAAPPGSGILLQTSTARAVLYSGLTSLTGFGALAFSYHAGTASMGQLLAVGMALTLICTLIVLPALLPQAAKSAQ